MIGKENVIECVDLKCKSPNCITTQKIPCSQQGCPLHLGPVDLPSSTCDIHSTFRLACPTSAKLGWQRPQWRPNGKRVEEFGGYERLWKSTNTHIPIKDSLGPLASCPSFTEWVSSTKYIPYGHRTNASNFQWVPSIQYVKRGHDVSATGEWRSSVHCAIPQLGEEQKFPIRPHRRVTGGTTYRHSIETCEGEFKTSLRYIPEFQPPCKDWRPAKSHVNALRTKFCTMCPESPIGSHINNILDETREKLNREVRTKCRKYHKVHPQFNLFHGHVNDVPLSAQCPCHVDIPPTNTLGVSCESSGKTPYDWNTKNNYDGKVKGHHIPKGNIDHFEYAVSLLDQFHIKAKPLRKRHEGKEHLSVLQRNAISGLLEHKDLLHPPNRHLGQKMYSPASKMYQYIMDGNFQNGVVERIQPLTEHRAQYATLKPWVAHETYQATSQACKDNKLNDTRVHPSINKFLYEDKSLVVS